MTLNERDFKNIQRTLNNFAHKKKLVSKERKYMSQKMGGLKIPDLYLKYLANKISWLRTLKKEERKKEDEVTLRKILGESERDEEEECRRLLEEEEEAEDGKREENYMEDYLEAIQPLKQILKEYNYPEMEHIQETGNIEVKAIAEILEKHGYTFWASVLEEFIKIREIIGIGNRKKAKLNEEVNRKRKARDERHKPIPTWRDSYWIGSTRSSLASGIKNNRRIIFHTTRPPERLKPTIRNRWARILTTEGLHRLGNVTGQDGVVKI